MQRETTGRVRHDPQDQVAEPGIASDNVLSLAGEIKPLSDRDGELTLFIECADAATALSFQA